MKKNILLLTGIVLLFSSMIFAQNETRQSQKTSIMEKFLGLDCSQDEKMIDRVHNELKRNAREAQEYFIQLIEKGPDKSWLEKEKVDAQKLYEIRKSFDENSKRKITFEGKAFDRGKPKPKGQREYIADRVKSYELRLAGRALEGLSVLQTSYSMKYLKEKAGEKNFPLRELAEELLKEG